MSGPTRITVAATVIHVETDVSADEPVSSRGLRTNLFHEEDSTPRTHRLPIFERVSDLEPFCGGTEDESKEEGVRGLRARIDLDSLRRFRHLTRELASLQVTLFNSDGNEETIPRLFTRYTSEGFTLPEAANDEMVSHWYGEENDGPGSMTLVMIGDRVSGSIISEHSIFHVKTVEGVGVMEGVLISAFPAESHAEDLEEEDLSGSDDDDNNDDDDDDREKENIDDILNDDNEEEEEGGKRRERRTLPPGDRFTLPPGLNRTLAPGSIENIKTFIRDTLSGGGGGGKLISGTSFLVDVLVIYTRAAMCAEAGVSVAAGCIGTPTIKRPMEDRITLAMTEMNTALASSGIATRMNLAHVKLEESYVETGKSYSDFLYDLAGNQYATTDVYGLREQNSADLVIKIVENTGSCGKAFLGPDSSKPYSVASRVCMTGNLSFAHELAHLMGCQHDKSNAMTATGTAFGYKSPDEEFRTILSYSCSGRNCPRIPRYSTPRVASYYDGKPVGTITENNAQQINDVKNEIINFMS